MMFNVSDLHRSRFRLAIERLYEGFSFEFDGISFWLSSPTPGSVLEVRVQSTWRVENVTEQTALSDFNIAEKVVNELANKSIEFAEMLKNHPAQYVLIDDYGTGAVEICRLTGDGLVWTK